MVAAFAAGTLPLRSGDVTRVEPDVRRGARQRLSDVVRAFCDALPPDVGLQDFSDVLEWHRRQDATLGG